MQSLDILPDLFDSHHENLTLLKTRFISFGKKNNFHGKIQTVQCFEDNSKVKELLATKGNGDVLIVDGQGSDRCALVGDLIAASAKDNGWAGVIVNGFIRDCATIANMELGVFALGAMPIKSIRKGAGFINIPIKIGDDIITPGDYVYADGNGVAISKTNLLLQST